MNRIEKLGLLMFTNFALAELQFQIIMFINPLHFETLQMAHEVQRFIDFFVILSGLIFLYGNLFIGCIGNIGYITYINNWGGIS